ncbi:hypothetical protein KY358_01455 [Candidatus Woesearchaeota archaeon]|nr:hypothetical protein [Candidatus Woesearchaeota archaeon]
MEKRGMIEVHFNWIFILIAGAVIFIFFINVVNKQREFSEVRTEGSIVTKLESLLTGAQASMNTVNIIDLPNIDIGFECNRYFIGVSPKSTRGNVIFSPGVLKGKEMITWALDWNVPYRATNFLYLTDPQLRYIIVDNNEGLGQRIYDKLPKEMNKELTTEAELGSLIDKNNYKVKVILLGNSNADAILQKLSGMDDESLTAANLTTLKDSSLIEPTGTIEFLEKNGAEWRSEGKSHYLKEESLFGAIFAEDKEMYDCVMRKAFRKLSLVSRVYLNRSSRMKVVYAGNSHCSTAYDHAITGIETIKEGSEKMASDFPGTSQEDMDDIKDAAKDISGEEGSANNLAKLHSCTLIY